MRDTEGEPGLGGIVERAAEPLHRRRDQPAAHIGHHGDDAHHQQRQADQQVARAGRCGVELVAAEQQVDRPEVGAGIFDRADEPEAAPRLADVAVAGGGDMRLAGGGRIICVDQAMIARGADDALRVGDDEVVDVAVARGIVDERLERRPILLRGGQPGIVGDQQRGVRGDEAGDRRARAQRHMLERSAFAGERAVDAEGESDRGRGHKDQRQLDAQRDAAPLDRLLDPLRIELALQRGAQRLAVGEACLGLFREQFLDDEAQALGAIAHHAVDRQRLLLRDLDRERGEAGAGESRLAGDHLVEHDAEREQVGTMIDRHAERLLGAHVARRADHLADHRRDGAALGGVGIGLGDARDAEIEQLGRLHLVGEQDVRWLDVAMDDAVAVRIGERAGELDADGEHPIAREAALLLQYLVERAAFDELHRDIGDVVGLADVVDRRDVGVAEIAGGLALAQEAARDLGITAKFGLEDLDRDDALDTGVVRTEHVGHRAFADASVDPVTPEHLHRRPPPR